MTRYSKLNISEILNTSSILGDSLVSFALLEDMSQRSGRSLATLTQEAKESNAEMIALSQPVIRIIFNMTLAERDFLGGSEALVSRNIWMN